MINLNYKNQPVAAFYKLLAKSFLFVFIFAIPLSLITFYLIKISILNSLGSQGIKEIEQLILNQPKSMMEQSKAMNEFILKYPSIISLVFITFITFILLSSYLFYITQNYIKSYSLKTNYNLGTNLIPNKSYFKILLYLCIQIVFLIFSSGFIVLSISANPIMGLIAGIFMAVFLVRTVLYIPGVIIGEMNFNESLKYSYQIISLGRGFKIIIFGSLLFLVLSFILSALLYFPSILIANMGFKMFVNLLILYCQLGFISVGMVSLFLRYGRFEEENIAE